MFETNASARHFSKKHFSHFFGLVWGRVSSSLIGTFFKLTLIQTSELGSTCYYLIFHYSSLDLVACLISTLLLFMQVWSNIHFKTTFTHIMYTLVIQFYTKRSRIIHSSSVKYRVPLKSNSFIKFWFNIKLIKAK